MNYGVVIPARNEAHTIKYCIRSLMNQSIKPKVIVVVDDGSEDKTPQVAEREGAYIVRIERKSRFSATGTPYLAFVINQGLKILQNMDLSFVMISGAESIYPENYVRDIVKNMVKDSNVVIASGIAAEERTTGVLSVRGSGRLINARWFKAVGFQYPLHYGYETWLLLKALSMGFRVAVYNVKYYLLRETSMNARKAYLYGKAMKALDYPKLYAFAKIMKMLLSKGGVEATYMLLGYFSKVKGYDDIGNTTKYILTKELLPITVAKNALRALI